MSSGRYRLCVSKCRVSARPRTRNRNYLRGTRAPVTAAWTTCTAGIPGAPGLQRGRGHKSPSPARCDVQQWRSSARTSSDTRDTLRQSRITERLQHPASSSSQQSAMSEASDLRPGAGCVPVRQSASCAGLARPAASGRMVWRHAGPKAAACGSAWPCPVLGRLMGAGTRESLGRSWQMAAGSWERCGAPMRAIRAADTGCVERGDGRAVISGRHARLGPTGAGPTTERRRELYPHLQPCSRHHPTTERRVRGMRVCSVCSVSAAGQRASVRADLHVTRRGGDMSDGRHTAPRAGQSGGEGRHCISFGCGLVPGPHEGRAADCAGGQSAGRDAGR